MWKASLFTLLIVGSSICRSATQDPVDLETKAARLAETTAKVNQDLEATNKLYAAAKAKETTAKAAYDLAQKKWDDSAGGIGGFFKGTGDPEFKRSLDAAKKSYDAASASADELSQKVDDLDAQSKDFSGKIKQANRDIATSNKDFAKLLDAKGAVTDFLVLKTKMGSTDKALDKMTQAYDKATIGAYVKDKIGLLLNSQLICQARRRCDVKEPAIIKNSDIEDALFPKTGDSTRQQQYYDKINPGKRTEGTTN